MKKNNKIILFTFGFISVIGIIMTFITMSTMVTIFEIFNLIMFLLVGFYFFINYKKPHGNLLRYLILIYTLGMAYYTVFMVKYDAYVSIIFNILGVMALVYAAGRLNKVTENIYIFSFALIARIVVFVTMMITLTYEYPANNTLYMYINALCPIILLIDIIGVYFIRYKDHIKVGQE